MSNGIDFKQFNEIAGYVLAVKKPILLRGRHGIGKSCVVYQTAEKMGLPVVERRASQMTEGDLLGLPSTDGAMTTWNPPAWFKQACEMPVVLFFDEVDRAVTEVRQGLFELTDSRKLAGHTLHPETVIMGAVNGGEDNSEYQVAEMDPAELDRWTVFDIQPTVNDWLDWGADHIAEPIWDFINNNHQHLEHKGEFEPNKKYPSRRSWHRLSDCLAEAKMLEGGENTSGSLYFLATGFVGFEAAVKFKDFMFNYSKVVTAEDIIDKGKLEKTKEFTVNDHTAMVEKIGASEYLKKQMSDEQMDNLCEYMKTMPSEVGSLLFSKIGFEANQGGKELQLNIIGCHKRAKAYIQNLYRTIDS